MPKIISTILFLFIAGYFCYAHPTASKKQWLAIVTGKDFKVYGTLMNVTDSSVILLAHGNRTDEINFSSIEKIKLMSMRNQGGKRIIGFLAGGIAGGVITGSILSKGKEGEPAALAGVVGGAGGGLLGGLAGVLLTPAINNMFATRKFNIKHNSVYYQHLKDRLSHFCLNK